MPDISFVVSCYNRPEHLLCCLASLNVQTHKNIEVIVTDNMHEGSWRMNEEYARQLGATYLRTNAPSCYHSAEAGAQVAKGRFLCFPSDDSFYCPTFAEEMLKAATLNDWDLVYCEMLHSWRGGKYDVLGVEPRLNRIDKTGFIIRRDKFYGFPDKGEGYCAADGLLIERLVAEGIKHGKVDNCLVVHS